MKHELKEQVALQCEAVARLAEIIAGVNRTMAELFRAGAAAQILDLAGKRTAQQMEILGDILNGMDAADETDDCMNEVFEESQRLWPAEQNK